MTIILPLQQENDPMEEKTILRRMLEPEPKDTKI